MQGYVSYKFCKKTKAVKDRSVLFSICVIILAVCIMGCLVFVKRTENIFENNVVYAVYIDSNKEKQVIEPIVDFAKSNGLAGIIENVGNKFYLFANVYTNSESANEIKNNLSKKFASVGVLKIECKKLSRSMQSKLKKDQEVYRLMKILHTISADFENKQLGYLQGITSESKLCADILQIKLNIEEILKSINNNENNEIKTVNKYAGLMILKFNSFFDNFYSSSKKSAILCEMVVEVALIKFEMFNNL